MDDDDEHYSKTITIQPSNSNAVRPISSARPSLQSSEMPPIGGVVNRWLDHFRTLDNKARTELMQSLTEQLAAQENLANAHLSFEKTKAKLRNLEAILDDEDASIQHELKRKAHERAMEEKKWEQEAAQWDPKLEPEPRQKTRYRNRRPQKSELEKLQEEAMMIMEHGTTDQKGAVAKETIAQYKKDYGEDMDLWPTDVREHARVLKLWSLENQ